MNYINRMRIEKRQKAIKTAFSVFCVLSGYIVSFAILWLLIVGLKAIFN
jgi:hypothetical protein